MKMEQIVPKRRHIKFGRRGIAQKKEYNNLTRFYLIGITVSHWLYLRNSVRQVCINFKLIVPFCRIIFLQFAPLKREASLNFYSFCVSGTYLMVADLDSRNTLHCLIQD